MCKKPPNKVKQNEKKLRIFKVLYLVIFAIGVRYVIMYSKYQNIIENHVEVSTPLSSWKRVLEGLFLISKNINPYSGDLLHETPLALEFYQTILKFINNDVNCMFILFDVATALLLYYAVRKYAKIFQDEYVDRKKYPEDMLEFLPEGDYYEQISYYVLMVLLFNPFSLLGCIGRSTMGIHNFFLSLFIYGMIHGSVVVSTFALAVSSSVSFYPLIFISPLFLYFVKIHKNTRKAILTLISFIWFLGVITFYNYNKYGVEFLENVYGCILTVPDLQPNIGLFWYFFTEMFEHFRQLFLCSFQINATILYLFPLSIKFRNRPFVLLIALLFLTTIFKSYPCASDVGFTISFLPTFLHLSTFCQQGIIITVMLLITSCLAPIVWYMWIYSASANANFYFGVTLAYAIAQIFLLTDILFAQTKWDFALVHGKQPKIDGEDAALKLE